MHAMIMHYSFLTELAELTGTPSCKSAETLSRSPSCAALSNAPVCTTKHYFNLIFNKNIINLVGLQFIRHA